MFIISTLQPAGEGGDASRADRVANYIDMTRKRISEFAMKTSKVGSSKMSKKLLEFLKSLERVYSIALALSHDMKVKMEMQLMDEFESGFVFI